MNLLKVRNISLYLLAFCIPLFVKALPIIIILYTVLWLSHVFLDKKSHSTSWKPLFLLSSFYLVHVIGLLYTSNLSSGLFDLEVKLSLLLFPILFLIKPHINKALDKKGIFISFILACVLAIFYCLVISYKKYKLTNDPFYFFYGEFSKLVHPTYFSLYLIFSIAVILVYFKHVSTKWKIINSFITLFLMLGIFLCASKAGIVISGIIILFIAMHHFLKGAKYLHALVFITAMLVIGGLTIKYIPALNLRFQPIKTIILDGDINNATEESSALRVVIWRSGYDIIKETMPFGVGTGDVKDVLMEKYKNDNIVFAFDKKLNAHNQLIQSTVALGLIGLVCLLIHFVLSFYVGIKCRNLLHIVFLIIIFINAQFESIFETQAGVVFFAFFNSLLYLNLKPESSHKSDDTFFTTTH